MVRFYSVDTLTSRIVGQLYPHRWSLTDPLRGVGTGSLTIALPAADRHDALVEATLPRRRWVAVQDDLDRFLWCGPFVAEPAQTESELTFPVADWRTWFYKAPIRPYDDEFLSGYFNAAASPIEQAVIYTDLLVLALDTVGAPAMGVDAFPVTGVARQLTAYGLERSTAEHLDDVRDRGGPEWFCYCDQDDSDPAKLVLHVKGCWPERRTRDIPIKIEWRLGGGGNVTDTPSWPGGEDVPTRVWGYGEGEPADRPYTSDEYPEIGEGTEVAWEQVIGPLDGVKTTATVHEHCYEAVQRSRGRAGLPEFSIAEDNLPLGDVATGDRARVVFDNGWTVADLEACRIVESTISGGPGEPTQRRFVVDLADDTYPDESGEPGSGIGEPGELVDDA